MSYVFLTTFSEIVRELGGYLFFPKKNDSYHITLSFRGDDLEIFDHLKLKISTSEKECGVVIRSEITNGKYMSLKEYIYLLVEFLEWEFLLPISLKPLTARFYFMGEITHKKLQLLN